MSNDWAQESASHTSFSLPTGSGSRLHASDADTQGGLQAAAGRALLRQQPGGVGTLAPRREQGFETEVSRTLTAPRTEGRGLHSEGEMWTKAALAGNSSEERDENVKTNPNPSSAAVSPEWQAPRAALRFR